MPVREDLSHVRQVGDSECEDQVVKARAEIVQTITQHQAEFDKKCFIHDRVVDVVGSIQFHLSPDTIKTDATGISDPSVKFLEVGFSTTETEANGSQGHGQ